MGISASCYSGSNSNSGTTTVKLVLLDGQLREFSSPIKVFLAAPPLNSFICNADDLDFDNYVTAMSGEEELRPGGLYFELPKTWLNRRLTVEDMASMAVKAGTAIMVSGGGGGGKVRSCTCWVKRVNSLVFYDGDDRDGDGDVMVSSTWGGGDGYGGGGRRGGGGKGRMFTRLERIEE